MAEIKIDKETLKPNSYKSKVESASERPKPKPVVRHDSILSTKETLGQKFSKFFVKEDMADIKDYIIFDLIIPGIKDAFFDTLQMIFYGNRSRRASSGSYRSEKISYSAHYKPYSEARREDRRDNRYETKKMDYRNIILSSRVEAEDLVAQMKQRIKEYGMVSIAEMFDMLDRPSNNYNDDNWGWTDERDIGWRRVSNGGFLIDVREAVYLE